MSGIWIAKLAHGGCHFGTQMSDSAVSVSLKRDCA